MSELFARASGRPTAAHYLRPLGRQAWLWTLVLQFDAAFFDGSPKAGKDRVVAQELRYGCLPA